MLFTNCPVPIMFSLPQSAWHIAPI